jgi:hypothetical protein
MDEKDTSPDHTETTTGAKGDDQRQRFYLPELQDELLPGFAYHVTSPVGLKDSSTNDFVPPSRKDYGRLPREPARKAAPPENDFFEEDPSESRRSNHSNTKPCLSPERQSKTQVQERVEWLESRVTTIDNILCDLEKLYREMSETDNLFFTEEFDFVRKQIAQVTAERTSLEEEIGNYIEVFYEMESCLSRRKQILENHPHLEHCPQLVMEFAKRQKSITDRMRAMQNSFYTPKNL